MVPTELAMLLGLFIGGVFGLMVGFIAGLERGRRERRGGYQPTSGNVDPARPPQGRSGVPRTALFRGELPVRNGRIDRRLRAKIARAEKQARAARLAGERKPAPRLRRPWAAWFNRSGYHERT